MSNAGENYGHTYLGTERWLSFVYQVATLRGLSPKSVAEVGIGPGVLGDMVRSTYPGCKYIGIDVDLALKPSICANVTALPFENQTFDATFCCQVLEHLPFDQFSTAISELKRVTRSCLIISLPDVSPFFYLRFPGGRRLLPSLWQGVSLPSLLPRQHSFEDHGQHYWEIGKRNYPVSRILKVLRQSGFSHIRHFRMVERNYWHFFILELQP